VINPCSSPVDRWWNPRYPWMINVSRPEISKFLQEEAWERHWQLPMDRVSSQGEVKKLGETLEQLLVP